MLSTVVFSNQKSGKNRWDWKKYRQYRGLERIKRTVKDGEYGKVYVTGKSGDYLSELDYMMQEACKLKPDVFIFDGGDSTIMTGITFLSRHWPEENLPLAATTAGGSFLMIPKRLKQRKTFKFLEDILSADSIDDLTVKGIGLMKVNDDNNNEHLSFSAGTGLMVDMLDEVYKRKSLKWLYAAALYLRTLASVMISGDYYKRFEHKQHMKVTAKGHSNHLNGDEPKEDNFLAIAAQTIDYAECFPWPISKIKVFNTFNKAENPGMFQAMGTTWNFERIFRYALIGELEAALTFNKQLREIKIQSEEPFRYQSNGDFSFGDGQFLTRALTIQAYRTVNFVIGR